MKDTYFNVIVLVERLHRLFLEVIKKELDNVGVYDINNVQTLILYNLADEELTVGELTNKGYYLGSNVSYNLRKMVQNGYIDQSASQHDKRSSYIKLSKKGEALRKKLNTVLDTQSKEFLNLFPKKNNLSDPEQFVQNLKNLEIFWKNIG